MIAGEHEFPLATLAPQDAAALFVERANAVRPGSSRASRVTRSPRSAGGSTTSRWRSSSRRRASAARAGATFAGAGAALALLTDGRRDLPERQRTLRATIAWSYDLLEETERRVFAALAAFSGGWTLESAEDVAGAHMDILASLVEKSLVQTDGERFRMLETIREFGFEELRAGQEDAEVARRHAGFFATLAERTEPELRSPRQGEALLSLDADYDNMRIGIERSIEHGLNEGVALAGYLVYYWYSRLLAGGGGDAGTAVGARRGRAAAAPHEIPRRARALPLAPGRTRSRARAVGDGAGARA